MRKIFVFFVFSFVLISLVFSAPSIGVSSGIIHNLTALDKASRLTFSTHTSLSVRDFPETYTLISTGRDTTVWDTYIFSDLTYGLAYTFTKWLELSVKNMVHVDAVRKDNDAPERINGNFGSYGFGDVELGVKLTTDGLFGSTDVSDMGIYGFYRLDTGDRPASAQRNASFASVSYIRNDGGIFRFFTSGSRDYGVIAITSFKTKTQVPMFIDINGGYVKRQIDPNTSAPNYWVYGGSFSAAFGSFIPFVELFGQKYVGRNLFDNKYIYYGCGGIRFDTPAGLVLDLSAEYRINKFAQEPKPDTVLNNGVLINDYYITEGWGAFPEWKFHVGLSYYYDFIKEAVIEVVKEEKKTLIAGKIVDAQTGRPISAIITLTGYSDDYSVISDTLGNYKIEVNPGTIRIKATREGYKWQEKGVIIEKSQTRILDFALNKKEEEMGIITGKVTDRRDGSIVIATISFPGTEIPNIMVDNTTGIYRIEIEPGTYTMAAIANDYITWSQPIVIENNKTLVLNIEMLKKGGKIELRGIYFDSGKASIKIESYPALDMAVKMLKDNPRVKIEIQGHTDSVGGSSSNMILSQARADAVRNYLINSGIEAWRITTKGYGDTMPIAPNTTRDGRAMNRRIEFLIIGE